MDVALDRRQRTLVERLARTADEAAGVAFVHELRGRLTESAADRRALVGLIEELVAADVQLAGVASSVGALLRSAIAADAVTATFTEGLPTDDIEDAFTPDDVLRIGRVRGQAEAAILAEPMFDAGRAAYAMGSRSQNPREFARKLREHPWVLALPVGNRYVFPAFQFNEARRSVWPLAAEVNTLLEAADDPWGVASFWFSVDPDLGARPADIVSNEARAADLRATAQRELAPVGW